MLTRVDVDDLQGHTYSFPLFARGGDCMVTEIEGLDPVKAAVTSSPFGQMDGETFQSSRRNLRNIVMHLRIEPYSGGKSVETVRKNLYQVFMPKTNVLLKFYSNDVLSYVISGHIESCETPLFTKQPEVNVSILCFDPDFRAPNPNTVSGGTVTAGTETNIQYPGTTETGFVFKLFVNRALASVSIIHRRPNGDLAQMDYLNVMGAGDILEVSTEFNDKHVTLTSGGIMQSALWGVAPSSKWPRLYPGANYFRVVAPGASVPYTLVYTPKYGGL